MRESIVQENYNNAVTNSHQILFILFTGKNQNIKWRHDSPKNVILNKTENEDMVFPKYLYEQLLTKNF